MQPIFGDERCHRQIRKTALHTFELDIIIDILNFITLQSRTHWILKVLAFSTSQADFHLLVL